MRDRIRIGFSLNRSEGGPALFMNNLKHEFDKMPGVSTTYFFDPFTSVNLFANKARFSGFIPYFFRVDGVAFDVKQPEGIRNKTNIDLIRGIERSRGVIYQSCFSRRLSESILNIKPHNFTTILNGTDLNFFSSHGENLRKRLGIEDDALVFVSSAKWRAHKRLDSVIKVFKEVSVLLTKRSYLIIIGEPDNKIVNEKGVITLGKINHNDLPATLRTGDMFLYFSWLDNCPNSVIEAIACGLPVICTNQGGTGEIVAATSGGIVVEADKPFNYRGVPLYEPPEPNYSSLIIATLEAMKNLQVIKGNINKVPIDIKITAKKYLEFMLMN